MKQDYMDLTLNKLTIVTGCYYEPLNYIDVLSESAYRIKIYERPQLANFARLAQSDKDFIIVCDSAECGMDANMKFKFVQDVATALKNGCQIVISTNCDMIVSILNCFVFASEFETFPDDLKYLLDNNIQKKDVSVYDFTGDEKGFELIEGDKNDKTCLIESSPKHWDMLMKIDYTFSKLLMFYDTKE